MVRILALVMTALGVIASGCGSDSLDKVKTATKPTEHLSNQGHTCGGCAAIKPFIKTR